MKLCATIYGNTSFISHLLSAWLSNSIQEVIDDNTVLNVQNGHDIIS